MRFFVALAPLVGFYLAETWFDLRTAVIVGMGLALVELLYTRKVEGRWSRMSVFTAVLIGVLGGMSLISDDPAFVLLTPAIGDAVFAAIIAVATWRGSNPIVIAVVEQDPELDLHPLQERFLDGLAWRFTANLLLHAALVLWASEQPRDTWMFVSGPLQYILMGAQGLAEAVWARWVVLPRVDAAEAAQASEGPKDDLADASG